MKPDNTTRDAAIELLPCPFCGATASFTEDNSPIRGDKIVWLVGCDSEDCPAMPLLCGNARKVDARKAWNSRAASASRKEIEWEFKKVRKMVEDAIPEHHRTGPAGVVYAAMVAAMDAVIEDLEKNDGN